MEEEREEGKKRKQEKQYKIPKMVGGIKSNRQKMYS